MGIFTMKDDRPLRIFKAAAYIAAGAVMAFVFVRNAFPVTGDAFVLDAGIEHSAPFSSVLPGTSTDNETSSIASSAAYSSEETPSEASSDTVNPVNSDISSSAQSSSETVTSANNSSYDPPDSQISSEQTAGVININTASSSELQGLTGIGEVKARAIIEYREQNGGFSSVDELINVKGIGEKTLEKIRDKITV